MLTYSLQVIVTAALVAAWCRRSRSAAAPPAVSSAEDRAERPARSPARLSRPKVVPRSLDLRIVFVDAVDGGPALLDCALTEPYGTVAPGAVFRMAVALPRMIDEALLARFERWADDDTIVHLVVTEGARAPKAAFSAGGTKVNLDLVASSPLRSSESRGG